MESAFIDVFKAVYLTSEFLVLIFFAKMDIL